MSGTIFDLFQEEIPEGKEGFLEVAKRAPEPKDDSFLETVKDYGKTFLKGSVEGISQLGRMLGPTIERPDVLEKQSQSLNELLPTDEGYIQKSVRRGLQIAPSAIAAPGSALNTLPRSVAAGFLGEGTKELGLPEWAQTAAELTAFITPDLTKKLLEKGSNKEIIKAAKEMGISDEALAPVLQPEFMQKWLTKLSPRRGRTESSLSKSKSELKNAYSKIQQSDEAKRILPNNFSQNLMQEIDEALLKMPSDVRNKIKTDFKDLENAPITGESLMNFYADVNHYLSDNAKQLALLKEPIKKAIRSTSPKLGEEFDLINNLYSKYHTIAARLKPNLYSDLLGAGESIALLTSVAYGNYPVIASFVGEKAAKQVAREMLVNPRMQQLSSKITTAFGDNAFPVVKKLITQLSNEIKKTSPEVAEKLKEVSIEELQDLFIHRQKEDIESSKKQQ